ncbi:hypothetical protein CPB83DRAFT_900416 [Crepidotus variabilis]|uniref:Uncharacterized protein n=1 Tax=Crepidotus variabilis TaxID=179855 RepID=A0A9P6JHP8_9AGAR|nr:hypothetical protein CPB83DRAFT_900416 [Crepidotus variabilis]
MDGTLQPNLEIGESMQDSASAMSLMTAYQVFNTLHLLNNGPPASMVVQQTSLSHSLPKNLLLDKLHNWRTLLSDFETLAQGLQIPPDTVNTPKTLSLFKSALLHHRQSSVSAVLANFEIAAGHLVFLCQQCLPAASCQICPLTLIWRELSHFPLPV